MLHTSSAAVGVIQRIIQHGNSTGKSAVPVAEMPHLDAASRKDQSLDPSIHRCVRSSMRPRDDGDQCGGEESSEKTRDEMDADEDDDNEVDVVSE